MFAGIVDPCCNNLERLFGGHAGCSRRVTFVRTFEALGRLFAVCFHITDLIFDAQHLGLSAIIQYMKGEMKLIPHGDAVLGKLQLFDADGFLLMVTEEGQRFGVALLQQGTAGMPDDPIRMRMLPVPVGGQSENKVRMVLRNVVQVIGDAFANV